MSLGDGGNIEVSKDSCLSKCTLSATEISAGTDLNASFWNLNASFLKVPYKLPKEGSNQKPYPVTRPMTHNDQHAMIILNNRVK